MQWHAYPHRRSMLFLCCFIRLFAQYQCNLETLFHGTEMEVFGQIVRNRSHLGSHWLSIAEEVDSELRLSFPTQSVSFLLHRTQDQPRMALESLFAARGFEKHEEVSFAEKSEFSLRAGYLMGNKSVRMTGFILDGLFSGFVAGSAVGEELNVRAAKFSQFLSNEQTPYVLTRKKLALTDTLGMSNFCGYKKLAGNATNTPITGKLFGSDTGGRRYDSPIKKSFCRLRYSLAPKATRLWLDRLTTKGPTTFRIRQLIGMILTEVYGVNEKLALLNLCNHESSACTILQLYIGYRDIEVFSPDFCLGSVSSRFRSVMCFDEDEFGNDYKKISSGMMNLFSSNFPCDTHCTCSLTTVVNMDPVLGVSYQNSFFQKYFRGSPNLILNLKRANNDIFLTPLELGIIHAHEIGHQMGAKHDDNNDCGNSYIMSSQYIQPKGFTKLVWSNCSKKMIGELYNKAGINLINSFPSNIPCSAPGERTNRSCLSPHICCDTRTCIVKHYKSCSPTGVTNADCCTESCDWDNGKKCWGPGDRQCVRPGQCNMNQCSASPLPDGTRCSAGVCLKGKCIKDDVCGFLKSTKCDAPMNSSASCFHFCRRDRQQCRKATLSDGKDIPLTLGEKCSPSLKQFGFCTVSHQCMLTDTSYVDWRRSIPIIFHPSFVDELGTSLVKFAPSLITIWISLILLSTYGYIAFVYSERDDILNEIYEELAG